MPSNLTNHRSNRKRQTKLAFSPVDPVSSAIMSPARITLLTSGSKNKAFDFSSSAPPADGAENQPPELGKSLAVTSQASARELKNGKLMFQPLPTPVTSSQPESGAAFCEDHLEVSDSDSSRELALSSLDLVRLSERLSLSPFKIPISPEQSDPISLPGAALGFKSTLRRRARMGYDGADDADDASFDSLFDEDETVRGNNRSAREAPSKTRTSLAMTVGDDEMETSGTPSRTHLERDRAMEASRGPRIAGTRRFISGGTTYNSPATRAPPNRSRRQPSDARSPRRETNASNRRSLSPNAEDDAAAAMGPRRRGNSGVLDVVQRTGSTYRNIRPHSRRVVVDSDDDLPLISSIAASRGRQRGSAIYARSSMQRRQDEEDEENEDDEDEDDDEDPVVTSASKRRRTSVIEIFSDNEDTASPLPKRLRQRSKGPTAVIEAGQYGQVNSEIDVEPPRRRGKRSQNKVKTARSKQMDLLRRRRAGENVNALSQSEPDDDTERPALYDKDSDLEALSEFEDEEPDEVVVQTRQRPRRGHRNSIDEEDDFLSADDEEPLGVPHHEQPAIPLQFTRHANKPLKEHFKDAIKWMVVKMINPADQDDDIYKLAFRKLNDEVEGFINSKFVSSVWDEDLVRALRARPYLKVAGVGVTEEAGGHTCGACKRTNHPAKYVVQCLGRAYYKYSLEEVEPESDEDDEDGVDGVEPEPDEDGVEPESDEDDEDEVDADSDEGDKDEESGSSSNGSHHTSINSEKQAIPSQDFQWYLGSTCYANAKMAHKLVHWKHAQNKAVLEQMHAEGHDDSVKVLERQDWSQEKLNAYVDGIIENWAGNGSAGGIGDHDFSILGQYRLFKSLVQSARDAKTSGRRRNLS